MSWKQVLTPNLDTDPNNPLYIYVNGSILTDWYGWCLAVVAGAYKAQGSSYSAKTAWESCTTKHYDRNIPEGVYTPLWYAGGEYGHVVIGYRSGDTLTVWTSPYTHSSTFMKFQGTKDWLLNYIGQVYGVGSFTGWSETVLSSRVIDKIAETKPEPEPDPEPVDDGKDEDMDNQETPEPVNQQLIPSIIEEAGSLFIFSDKTKLIAYVFGDFLLIGGLLTPLIISAIQAPTLEIFGEYLAKILLEAGVAVLMVFKLIKKKS